MNSRFGTMSTSGFCHIHGSFSGISCGMCNGSVLPQVKEELIEGFDSFCKKVFAKPRIEEWEMDTILTLLTGNANYQLLISSQPTSLERNVVRTRLFGIIKKHFMLYIDSKQPVEPI